MTAGDRLEKTLMRIHGGLQIWLRSFYKAYKVRCVIPLNETHSDLGFRSR